VRAYRREHQHAPARLVILKTSRFQPAEAEGMLEAARELDIPQNDLVWVSEGTHQTFFREGDYPPLRGSAVQLGNDLLLFTRGSVPYYGTYPGMRMPRPLLLRPHACDTAIGDLGAEILALTKMNWNSTQFDQRLPIPIRAARQVGRVLKYVSPGIIEQSDYRYYI
jgi:argonaute-like protein implicated in RNA metabolism and viral defense